MKDLLNLKEKLWDEISDLSKRNELSAGDLEIAQKITDTIKNIDKICLLENGESDDGYSGARHYVRAHYSRANHADYDRYPGRRGRDGRYSSDYGRDEMMSHLSAAMATSDEEDREMIQRFMEQMRNR